MTVSARVMPHQNTLKFVGQCTMYIILDFNLDYTLFMHTKWFASNNYDRAGILSRNVQSLPAKIWRSDEEWCFQTNSFCFMAYHPPRLNKARDLKIHRGHYLKQQGRQKHYFKGSYTGVITSMYPPACAFSKCCMASSLVSQDPCVAPEIPRGFKEHSRLE